MKIKELTFKILKHLSLLLVLISIISCQNSENKPNGNKSQSIGPKNGALLIGGGGITDEMWHVFYDLAGGESAKLVIIPTAFDESSINYDPEFKILKRQFTARGFDDIRLMHTRDTLVANSDDFVQPLKTATAVWLTGGRQWRTADAYLNTKTHFELKNVLKRGGIIGGHSAGASIQGSYLVRGGRNLNGNYSIISNPEIGFGLVTNTAFDQHHLDRNRHYDMFDLLKIRPELLGVGIDEDTGILVQGNEFQVIGNKYVSIYDNTFWSPYFNEIDSLETGKNKFYVLKNGDKYNLKERRVQRNKFIKPKNISFNEQKEYIGNYLFEKSKVFWNNIVIENDTLKFQVGRRNIVRDPIPIYAYGKDLFFDTDAEFWFHFTRDSLGTITGFEKRTHQFIDGLNQRFNKITE
ncbi:cyanophycinase [uncultured Marixanthomonas sp.]|uniref:cyanophycinase n=1 Tax=uncultured Marixanthomonas sp. TaxID=757245 RepID=UPI0030D7CCAF|tara:strand:- start:164336 stop:165559 length:1224 start_codon:yes stop_codon:yes gene_type:complete